jgi:hypothetical protein
MTNPKALDMNWIPQVAVARPFCSVQKDRFKTLEQSLAGLSTSIADLMTSPSANGVVAL